MIKSLEIKSVIEGSMLSIYFQSDKEEFNTKGGKKAIHTEFWMEHLNYNASLEYYSRDAL